MMDRSHGESRVAKSSSGVCAASLHALLQHSIDYAGLFPPATLTMAASVQNYATFWQLDDSWMLGRLIVPAARLTELADDMKALRTHSDSAPVEPWLVSAVLAPAGSSECEADMTRVHAFNYAHADDGIALIDVVEMKADEPRQIDRALDATPDAVFPFFEIPIGGDPRGLIACLAGADAGAKVRTGGATAEMYPSPSDVSRFLSACAAAEVPFKATAGLHHPLRHYSEAVRCQEFGFLNVFVAACLAFTNQCSGALLERVLQEDSPDHFAIDDDVIGWNDISVRTDEIVQCRNSFVISFGSCSFDEPRDDLRRMNLMPRS